MAKTFLNDKSVVRGLRNNNPGNIIRTSDNWQGKVPFAESTDSNFEQFSELKWGIRAFYKNALNSIAKGYNTPLKLISKYAPAFENDTNGYIAQVSNQLGVSSNSVLKTDKDSIIKLAKAMFRVELGADGAAKLTEANYTDAWVVLGSQYQSEAVKKCELCGKILGGIAVGLLTVYTFIGFK